MKLCSEENWEAWEYSSIDLVFCRIIPFLIYIIKGTFFLYALVFI